MESSTENKIEGKFHEIKGQTEEETGKSLNDPTLETEGTVEKIAGKIQEKFGKVQKVIEKQ